MSASSLKPWYRHPWPWILMAGPVTVVLAGIVTVYLAVVSNDGLVDDDYYKQGLAVNQMAARDRNAAVLGLQADLQLSVDSLSVGVLLRASRGDTLPPQVLLRVVHPTRTGVDQKLVLRAQSAGRYEARLVAPLQGRWHVILEDDAKAWRLTGDWVVDKDRSLRLSASATASTNPAAAAAQ